MADLVNRDLVAAIGCGPISEFHVPALREAGLRVTAVATRAGSLRLTDFAQRHHIPLVFDDWIELLRARDGWDALLIASRIDATIEVFRQALEADAPILVEKPVALSSSDLTR